MQACALYFWNLPSSMSLDLSHCVFRKYEALLSIHVILRRRYAYTYAEMIIWQVKVFHCILFHESINLLVHVCMYVPKLLLSAMYQLWTMS